MDTNTTIDLIRHGQPVGGRRYRGQIDDPLSDLGWQQMRAAVGDHCPWNRIISSPLSRCRAFAGELAERHSLPLQLEDRIKEVGFGGWEGQTGAQLESADPGVLTRFYHDPIGHRPEGAEPLEDFFGRVNQALDEVLEAHRGEHVLLVTHAGVIRAVLTRVMQAPLSAMYRLHVETASITRIRMDGKRPLTLLFHGGSLT
ncbi:MAG: alpha-ribazole phosphatase family protein [Chromatiales bacterium]|nr:alpha-ribazole phosphatase family protein [Chromatiales bacterium]